MSEQSSAESNTTRAKPSSPHDLLCAHAITDYLLRSKSVAGIVWYAPSSSALRMILLNADLRREVKQIHPQSCGERHQFWKFYVAQSGSAEDSGGPDLPQNHVEFDFFA